MPLSFHHSQGSEAPIAIPAIGLDLLARQYIIVTPGLDAFFSGLGEVMRNGRPDQALLNVFAKEWAMEFLGPPLTP